MINYNYVCIVGVKLPRVLSHDGEITQSTPCDWGNPQEFDTNNTHTIVFDPLNKII